MDGACSRRELTPYINYLSFAKIMPVVGFYSFSATYITGISSILIAGSTVAMTIPIVQAAAVPTYSDKEQI